MFKLDSEGSVALKWVGNSAPTHHPFPHSYLISLVGWQASKHGLVKVERLSFMKLTMAIVVSIPLRSPRRPRSSVEPHHRRHLLEEKSQFQKVSSSNWMNIVEVSLKVKALINRP